MQNRALIKDYLVRSQKRIKAVETLFQEEAWADVVRESQEVLELTLKSLLRSCSIEAPRIHDVSSILDQYRNRLPPELGKKVDKMISISKYLRRDRELAFYGSEDLTPSEFYSKKDATEALESVKWVLAEVLKVVKI